MDKQTLNTIAEWELQEDIRRAEERAVKLGFMDSNGILTAEGEEYFFEWLFAQRTLH